MIKTLISKEAAILTTSIYNFLLEPASCNATHMTIDIPAFPGSLAAVNLDDKNIRFNQLQAQGIGVDTRRGVKLYINKRDLKSRVNLVSQFMFS